MKSRVPPGHVISLGVAVYVVWLVLSGHYTPFLLAIGLACTALVVFIAIRMDLVDEEGVPLIHLTRKIWTYIPWLFVEIVRSNLAVARIVLQRDMPISPTIIRFRGKQKTDIGRVIFANSITLTPGTVTVGVAGDEFFVHGIVQQSAIDMEESEMNSRVAELERVARSH